MRKEKTLLALALASALMLSGCGAEQEISKESSSQSSQSSESASEETQKSSESISPEEMPTLVYATFGDPSQVEAGGNEVYEKLNEITREKIGCNLEILFIPVAQIETQIQTKLAAEEQVDLMFCSNWLNNYAALVSRGALLPLDDLLPEYAPEYYAMIKEEWWDCTRVGGKIYAGINQQIFARQPYLVFLNQALEKTGFDPTTVDGLEDLGDYFAKAVDAGYTTRQNLLWKEVDITTFNEILGFESIGGELSPGVVSYDATSKPEVINQFESEEFKGLFALINSWAEEGYVPADALSATIARPGIFRASGAYFPYSVENTETAIATADWGTEQEVTIQTLGEPYITTDSLLGTLIGVNAQTKYPEKAVELLNLINTDAEFYNTLIYGIEGRDYELTDEGKIVELPEKQYSVAVNNWAYGNTFNGYVPDGVNSEIWKAQDELNKSARCSVLLGFSFDASGVQTEVANCSAVITEYINPLRWGVLDMKEYDTFLKKLDDAGIDKIIAAKQAQIDEWWAANK